MSTSPPPPGPADDPKGLPLMLTDFAPETAEFYYRDPDAAFAHLRADDPVHWYDEGGFWCITRRADIREVSRSPKVFSSEHGLQMWQIQAARDGGQPGLDGMDGGSILAMDPPEHIRHRRLVTSAFKPRYIEQLGRRVRELTEATLDACDPTAEVEFVEQIAVPVPMLVIAEMIGVPGADRARFRRWSDSIVVAGAGGMTKAVLNDIAELFAYFTESLAEHRADPRDDIITMLLDAEVEGEHLEENEILMFLLTLLVAGNETTRNLVAGGTLALAEHPDQRAALAADPSLIPNAVEEMLRWVTPVRSFIRRAVTDDASVGGVAIPEGDHVVLFYGSGNRDEDVFGATAARFDITRDNADDHIAFGFGEHLCLGAHLARLEARIVFEELLDRWPEWQLAGEARPLPSCLMNGLDHMPVRLDG